MHLDNNNNRKRNLNLNLNHNMKRGGSEGGSEGKLLSRHLDRPVHVGEHGVDLPDLVVPLVDLCANGCVRYMMCGTKEMINPV